MSSTMFPTSCPLTVPRCAMLFPGFLPGQYNAFFGQNLDMCPFYRSCSTSHPSVPFIRPLSTNSAHLCLSSIFGGRAFGSATTLWAVSRKMPSLLTRMTSPRIPLHCLVLWTSWLSQLHLLASSQIVFCQPCCLLRSLGSSLLYPNLHIHWECVQQLPHYHHVSQLFYRVALPGPLPKDIIKPNH